MPKKKFTLVSPLGDMDFEVSVSNRKPKKVKYREKTLNLATLTMNAAQALPGISILAAKCAGMSDREIHGHLNGFTCSHGKEVTLCARCSRKEGTYISR